jgi:chemotaxis regulatin CheY-phosphate phosphatase CheZ
MLKAINIKQGKELLAARGKAAGIKLQTKLCGILKIIAQRVQHSHLAEIGYLTRLLEATHQELANCRLNLPSVSSAEIISREEELKELIQQYLVSNQRLSHFLNQLSPAKLGEEGRAAFLKQVWHTLKQFYCQQEDREGQLITKYKEFQRRVKHLQKQTVT